MPRWILIGVIGGVLCADTMAQFGAGLEGIAFSISSSGSYAQSKDTLELSDDEFADFTSFRIASRQELRSVWEECVANCGLSQTNPRMSRGAPIAGPPMCLRPWSLASIC